MLIVRDIFIAKPGQASKLAKLFKKAMAGEGNTRVMTDLVSNYNTVVMEMQVENLVEFQKHMDEYRSGKMKMDPDIAQEMSKYTDMYVSGRREILQVVD